ncbi:MAG TPA: BTAD domain-containing putative transcriptional regulator [Anaerolineales bacterium]|nr:BTAD domain-containing putative transcriptional regulator [Anaerolineales bacterium]
MSPRLALHFLGPPQIHLDNETITLERRKALALLGYLALERGGHSRESLSALLWPDTSQSNAFKNLRQILWEIQKTVGEGWLMTDQGKVGLRDEARIWLDVHEFKSRLVESRAQQDLPLRIALLTDSARLYRNHFLTGFSLKDAHPFNDWAFAESEDLRHKFSMVLSQLSEDYCAMGQAGQAIPHARRLVALDPLNEAAHRQLMEVYLQAGQQNAALKQYETCEQILRKELNLDPQPETRELYKKIRKGEMKPVQAKKQTEIIIPQHNLPHQLSTFVGREKEQTETINLIAKKRLVTLVGAGGIGKTSLSVQVGRKVLNTYPNGVWFIALESLSDPALTAQTVASIFDIREAADRPLLEKLIDSLRSRNALLIFDNCEHLLDACAQLITALLTSCPNIKVLVTSREALGVPGEAIYTMPSLPLPEPGIVSIERLTEFESVQLFAERAALALTSFQLSEENIQTVVDICRKVDGIPLAIELAAARVNILHVEEILAQLQDSFALLASDTRTILPRHQTLQASMDWSWGLLDEMERVFLQQLSVFAGGWTLEAAQAVCGGNVLDLTGALVKKSLIVVQQTGRGTRYGFHEIVREYALQKLIDSGDQNRLHTWHLGYFLGLAERAELELRGPALVDWMERLNDERNNFRVALHWADKIDVEAGLYLSSKLMRYWESANLPEGRRWLEKFIDKPESKDFPLARAHALSTYSWLLTWLQGFDQALAVAEESLALFRAAGDRQGEVDVLIALENMYQFKDEIETSLEIGKQALFLAESLGDRWRQANALLYLGWGYHDLKQRFGYWERAISLYREVGDQVTLANLLGLLGQFRVLHGDFELGEKCVDEAMRLWQANRRANIWDNPRVTKSLIAMMKGEYEQAETLLRDVMISAQERGNRMSYFWAQVRLGHVLLRSGSLTEAHQVLTETAQNFEKDGYTIGAVFALEGMAELFVSVGKPEHAARLIGWADLTREKIQDTRPDIEQADADKVIAACLAKMGEAAFSDAYDEGQAMTLDQAVGYALGQS